MKGFLYKDLMILRNQMKILIVMGIFYMAVSIMSESAEFFGGLLAILCAMLPITTIAYDEKAKWDKYALSMPVSRNQLVISKYGLGLILSIFVFLLNFVIQMIFNNSIKESLLVSVLFLGVSLFIISILFPVIFKFGVEKGRIMMMMIMLIPVLLFVFIDKRGITFSHDLIDKLPLITTIGLMVMMVLSIILSCNIYKGKEFA